MKTGNKNLSEMQKRLESAWKKENDLLIIEKMKKSYINQYIDHKIQHTRFLNDKLGIILDFNFTLGEIPGFSFEGIKIQDLETESTSVFNLTCEILKELYSSTGGLPMIGDCLLVEGFGTGLTLKIENREFSMMEVKAMKPKAILISILRLSLDDEDNSFVNY